MNKTQTSGKYQLEIRDTYCSIVEKGQVPRKVLHVGSEKYIIGKWNKLKNKRESITISEFIANIKTK